MYKAFCKIEIVLNAIINMVINGVAAWVIFRLMAQVPLNDGIMGMTVEFLLAAVFIAFFVTLFPIISIKKKMNVHKLKGVVWKEASVIQKLISQMPENKIILILINIMLALIVFYVPSYLYISEVLDVEVTGNSYFLFKTIYCTLLATVVAYPVSCYAVTDRRSL